MSKNPLLEKEIQSRIKHARYVEPPKSPQKKSIFYLTVVFLVTLSVLVTLLRYF